MDKVSIETVYADGRTLYPFTHNIKDLFEDGMFFKDTLKYVVTNKDAASAFLSKVEAKEILLNNAYALEALYEIHNNIRKKGSFLGLKDRFVKLLGVIKNEVHDFLDCEYTEDPDDDLLTSLNESYAYGPGTYLQTGIMAVRHRAFVGYVLACVQHMERFTDVTDLMGEVIVKVSNAEIEQDIISALGAIEEPYSGCIVGFFSPLEPGIWSFTLPNLGPFPERLIYLKAAYQYCQPLLGDVLSAKVSVITELRD